MPASQAGRRRFDPGRPLFVGTRRTRAREVPEGFRVDPSSSPILSSSVALHELIPDARADGPYIVAVDRHGRVGVSRTLGAQNREGGEVESFLVVPMHHPGEKLSLMEFFEVEHLDDALARFEELRPRSTDTTRAP